MKVNIEQLPQNNIVLRVCLMKPVHKYTLQITLTITSQLHYIHKLHIFVYGTGYENECSNEINKLTSLVMFKEVTAH